MPDVLPDEIDIAWFMKNRGRVRDAIRETEKANLIVGPEGQLAPAKSGRESVNRIYDLRITETSAEPLPIEPPVLSLTVDQPDLELDLDWTLPETYNELFLERSEDGETWTPLLAMPGTQDAYEDSDVDPGTEYFYRIRGRVGGAYSAYSNVVSGELESAECEYVLPDDMGLSTAFKQGFVGSDYVDAAWNSNMQGGCTGITLSDNGRKVVTSGALGAGYRSVVLTREEDNSFTAQILNPGTGVALPPYVISRNGIIAGRVEAASIRSAVWASGPTSAPTEDTNINWWQGISADGTKLYGVTDAGLAIERTIGGGDVTIATGCWAIFGINQVCGDCVIVGKSTGDDFLVYRNIAGTWTHVATLADTTGDTENASAVIGMNGDATKAFGSNAAATVPYWWDITGTGTINATAMGVPIDDTGARCLVTGIASSGNVVVGEYEPGITTVGAALYWLASESFATAHNLDLYFTAEGITGMGNASGEYFSLDTARVSADGTQYAYRCQKGPSGSDRNLFFAAVPAPT